MTKLALKTQCSGYSFQTTGSVVAVKLDGGTSRYRRDVLNPASTVAVSWTLSQESFDYLIAFFETTVDGGSLPFTVDLAINSQAVATYTAYFVADSLKYSQGDGGIWTASATLEVGAIIRDATADDSLVAAYNALHS